jgi:hypothetical protein
MLACTSALACPGGGVAVCADGYSGDLCSTCAVGYFHRQLQCERCRPANRALAIGAIFILIVIALAVYWIANPSQKGPTEGVEIMSSSGSVASEVGEVIFFLQTVCAGAPALRSAVRHRQPSGQPAQASRGSLPHVCSRAHSAVGHAALQSRMGAMRPATHSLAGASRARHPPHALATLSLAPSLTPSDRART